jgi:hypothetical protein
VEVTILNSPERIPAPVIDLSEEGAVLPQPGAARSMVLDGDESIVTVTLGKVGPLPGQDVSMQIYLQ